MFLSELSEPKLIVVYAGRFQPFHLGHKQAFEWLCGKYGRDNVYIATSDKIDGDRSPFSFSEKNYFMQLAGVPADRIVQATSPYKMDSVLSGGNIQLFDRSHTVAIFAVSQKDMETDEETGEGPRFTFDLKKDGSKSYYQPLPKDIRQTENMDQHGYILTVPIFPFNILDEEIDSATTIRDMYRNARPKHRQQIIKDLFGQYTPEAQQIMDNKLGRPVTESKFDPKSKGIIGKARISHPFAGSDEEALALYVNDKEEKDFDTVEREERGLEDIVADLEQRLRQVERGLAGKQGVAEDLQFAVMDSSHIQVIKQNVAECGGVGVVKGGNDPRYVMATAGDQNAVNGSTLGKEMAAYGLVGRKSPGSSKYQRTVSNGIGKGTKK